MTHRLRATEFSDSCITPEPTSRRQGAGNCLLFVALQEVEGLAGFPSLGDRHRGSADGQTGMGVVWAGEHPAEEQTPSTGGQLP